MIRILILSMALLVHLPARASTVSVSNFSTGAGCGFFASQLGVPDASATIEAGGCFQSPITVTATASNWTAGVSVSGGFGDAGTAEAYASLNPTALILGGTGSGFLRVQFTDEIHSGSLWCCFVSLSAGDLTAAGALSFPMNPYSLSDTVWSGFLPFTFGEPVELPSIAAGLSFDAAQAFASGWARETITGFDIRDAGMNPIAGAFAIAAPEPSPMWLCLGGLILGMLGQIRYAG